ncbi:MAG: hydroxyisourate hydrolase [Bacteroidota bacterium]
MRLTTHVLDTSIGKPASKVSILLERRGETTWEKLAYGVTDDDGRMSELPAGIIQGKGSYRLTFETGAYFLSKEEISFYPQVIIEFYISEDSHYHVPLLISPYGYSTYRGS